MAKNALNKSQKLKSKKSIEALFRTGKTITSPPFKLLYRKVEEGTAPLQMTVAVPKKLIKKAIDRNLIKRRTREAYRLNNGELFQKVSQQNKHLEILFLYQSAGISEYKTIKNAIKFLLLKLSDSVTLHSE